MIMTENNCCLDPPTISSDHLIQENYASSLSSSLLASNTIDINDSAITVTTNDQCLSRNIVADIVTHHDQPHGNLGYLGKL